MKERKKKREREREREKEREREREREREGKREREKWREKETMKEIMLIIFVCFTKRNRLSEVYVLGSLFNRYNFLNCIVAIRLHHVKEKERQRNIKVIQYT
jgi:hypothetical protein